MMHTSMDASRQLQRRSAAPRRAAAAAWAAPRSNRAPRPPPAAAAGGPPAGGGLSYKAAGVDIDAGDELVRRIQKLNPSIGGFSGLVPFGDSYLVAGTDGVGTKLKLAFDMDKHDTVGIDLVAMSVNDIVTSGAQPLFFLDYYATGKLDVDAAEQARTFFEIRTAGRRAGAICAGRPRAAAVGGGCGALHTRAAGGGGRGRRGPSGSALAAAARLLQRHVWTAAGRAWMGTAPSKPPPCTNQAPLMAIASAGPGQGRPRHAIPTLHTPRAHSRAVIAAAI